MQNESVQTTGEYIRSQNGLYVWPAGNSNSNMSFFDHQDVIIVGATTIVDQKASFSNFGKAVDVVAPGVDIQTTELFSQYGAVSGTSFSAPMTAGLLGLIYSSNASLTPQTAELILQLTAVDLGDPGEDNVFGAGRINAAAAVQLALDAANMALPPMARDDRAVSGDPQPLLIDVLANDADLNGDPISIVSFDSVGTSGGMISRSVGTGPGGRDELRYDRPPGFEGDDEFGYTIEDPGGLAAAATVRVAVFDAPQFDARVDYDLQIPAVLAGPNQIVAADVDNDGDLDLAASIWDIQASVTSEGVVVLLNNGDGTFNIVPGIVNAGAQVISIAAGDFNGDQRDDVVVGSEQSNRVTVMFSDGLGGFSSTLDFPTEQDPRRIVTTDDHGDPLDLNGDLLTDIAFATRPKSRSVCILWGRGPWRWSSAATPDPPSGFRRVA